jgi:O-antigen/teichoic acid export membrane protein
VSNLAGRVAWNTIVQSAARLITLALALLTTVLLTRHLGVAGYGIFVTVTVYVPFFALFFDAGMTTFVVRELSTGHAGDDLFRETLGFRIALAVPVTALALLLALGFYADETTTRNAIAIALPIILFATTASATSALFQARLRMDRVALAEIAGQLVATALIVVFVVLDFSIYAVVAAAVAGSFVNMAFVLSLASRIESVTPIVRPRGWGLLLRRALPLGLAVMVGTVYFRADVVLLSILKGSRAVGIYGVAYRLLEVLVAFPGFFYISVFPLLAQAAAHADLARLRGLTQRSFDVLVLAAVPVVFGVFFLAPQIVDAVAGDDFAAAVVPLRIVIVGAGLMFVNGLLAFVLIAVDRELMLLATGLATLFLNVALNLALIPPYSYKGAASVAVGSEAVTLAVLVVLLARAVGFVPDLRVAAKGAIAGGVMVACLAITPTNLALLLVVGVSVYAAALLLLRAQSSLQLRELLGVRR